MNPASFNNFIRILEDISDDVFATPVTRRCISDAVSESVQHLEASLKNGLQ